MSSLYTPDQGEKRLKLSWAEPRMERSLPSITEITSQAGGYLSLYKEDMGSLVWLLVRHLNHLTQRDLALHNSSAWGREGGERSREGGGDWQPELSSSS